MKAVIQRVKQASVSVDGHTAGSIEKGILVFVGVCKGDDEACARQLAEKTAALRIFSDQNAKMNRSVLDIGGSALIVSNFTLCADVKKGTRPSFDPAMPPEEAQRLFTLFCRFLKTAGVIRLETGVFGADMEVSLCNDGPVTVMLDTDIWRKK